nr:hypothetical protein HK105_007680 [Polyrhizophydium stewartii]
MTVAEADEAMRHHYRTFYASCYGAPIMQTMRATGLDVAAKTVVLTFPVTDTMLNPVGTLHGGAIVMIADTATSTALGFFEPAAFASVTVDLTCQFIGASRPGDLVDVRCVVTKVGKSMAYMRFDFTEHGKPDKVLASGVHTKFVLKPKM